MMGDANGASVKKIHFEVLIEREQTTLRLPAELKEQLQKEASVKGISLNGYILFLINVGRCSLNK